MSKYELVMYSRTSPCPFVSLAKRVLESEAVPYRELYIDQERTFENRVLEWTGFLSVPTLIVADAGEIMPYQMPTPLAAGMSPRGINRGTMITEANIEQLTTWLTQNGFINAVDGTEG